ncbi:RING-type E3 ubiquitin transferase [Sarracenia purpurea var. burkii]
MSAATASSSTTQLFQEFLEQVYPRRLLLHTPLYQSPSEATPLATRNNHDPPESYAMNKSFDTNVVLVVSVLLCALICSLGLNSIIRCALRCSRVAASESSGDALARLADTGIKKKALKRFETVGYSVGLKLPGSDTECAICLSEFMVGERVRVLPKCSHGFHVGCIDKWLKSHSSCPTCRHCLIGACQKIVVSCSRAGSSAPPPPPPPPPSAGHETIVSIAPLDPEGLVRDYRG